MVKGKETRNTGMDTNFYRRKPRELRQKDSGQENGFGTANPKLQIPLKSQPKKSKIGRDGAATEGDLTTDSEPECPTLMDMDGKGKETRSAGMDTNFYRRKRRNGDGKIRKQKNGEC